MLNKFRKKSDFYVFLIFIDKIILRFTFSINKHLINPLKLHIELVRNALLKDFYGSFDNNIYNHEKIDYSK